MELEIINKLFLELSQIATAKTAREIKLEKEFVDERYTDILAFLMFDLEKGWAKISSDLETQGNGFNVFKIRFEDGSEHEIEFKISEV